MKRLLTICIMTISMMGSYAQNIASSCYRAYVDAGYTIGMGDYELGRFEVNTSHGYQISPYFFIGAGIGLHFMPEYETPDMDIALDTRESSVDIPVFANVRANFTKGKITPFVDLKGGTYLTNNGGLYANLSIGCRIATNAKNGIYIAAGYTMAKIEFETFERFTSSSSMDYTRSGRKCDTEGISIKVGYEF